MTDKTEEAKFKFAIEAMRPALQAAADAAHELELKDEDEADFERVIELGMLTDSIGILCGPLLRVLNNVASMLARYHAHDHTMADHDHDHDAVN